VIETFSFVVHASDKRGRPLTVGGAKIEATVTKPDGQQCKETKVDDKNDGTYVISFKAQQGGNFKISTKIDGKEIVGSPFEQKIANNF
jgi:uncharacterized protein YfaS (alpha-2-macroglobulin family)